MKIYIKKGNKNYKENKMIKDLTAAFEKKMSVDPNFQIKPAENFAELQKMHLQYCTEDAEVLNDTPSSGENTSESAPAESSNEESTPNTDHASTTEKEGDYFDSNIDPMNREAPNVRDYVDKTEYPGSSTESGPAKTSWDEPTSFKEAFEIPSDDPDDVEPKSSKSNNHSTDKPNQPTSTKKPSINPDFDEMSSGKKKRSTKKFAKYIVETVCMLAEKGFVWYANKDINESKLAEYELNGTMDLNILLEMPDNQSVTVKQFFQHQCIEAEKLAVIDPEEKKDLIEALAEVLLEKGVAPTPSQELGLIALKIFGGQAVALMQLKSQTNSLLNQLKAMKSGETTYEDVTPDPEPVKETPQQTSQPTTPVQESSVSDESGILDETEPTITPYSSSEPESTNDEDLKIITTPQETKE